MQRIAGLNLFPFISSHVFALIKDAAFHGVEQVIPARPFFLFELSFQGINPEIVAMRFTFRRAGPSVANLTEIVLSLNGAVFQVFFFGNNPF